ncbi:MAG: ATP-binding protein [Lachnospiraceae bacterium]|nr:ATP-binding protein [Lachnospiraceae bacterium]
MKFIGRDEEIKKIKEMYKSAAFEALLLYGRRRIGKSELIKHSLQYFKGKKIYYECKQTSEKNNVESLSALLSDAFDFPPISFQSFEEILRFLFRRAEKEDILLVIDEYSYLSDVLKGMDSILQSIIDEFKEKSRLKLILCGSYVDTMQKLIEKENPLFGRFSYIMKLQEMNYYDTQQFYPTFSSEDKVRLYSVFGGIPYYNRLIDEHKTVRENILSLIASPGARLENEVLMYLKSEISKIINANEVFETMAKGFSRFNDILSQSHVSSGPSLVDTLDKLIRMELIEKEAPINEEDNRKKAGYFISDNMSLFYYRYIFRYSSQMNILPPEVFFTRFIQDDFENAYVSKRFERIAKQYLLLQNRRGKMEEAFERIGKYYYNLPKEKRNGEFDIVTLDLKGYIFYEVKFQSKPLSLKQIEKEIAQVEATGLRCYRYGFISRSGFEEAVHAEYKKRKELLLLPLEELFR